MRPTLTALERVIKEAKMKIIIAADVNAWSPLWGSKELNLRGRVIEEWLMENGLICLNDPHSIPTFSGPQGSSHIDVTLTTPEFGPCCMAWKARHDTVSDHATIRAEIGWRTIVERVTTRRFGEANADWDRFREELARSLTNVVPVAENYCRVPMGELEKTASELQGAVLTAAEISLPRISTRRLPPKKWWSQGLKKARGAVIAARKSAMRMKGTDRAEAFSLLYKKLRKAYKTKIIRAKRSTWRKFVEDSTANGPWGAAFRVAKSRDVANTPAFPAFIAGGAGLPSSCAAAHHNALAEIYGADRPEEDTELQREVRNQAKVPPATGCSSDWDEVDVAMAIERNNRSGAPGRDGITSRMLYEAREILAHHLVRLYNACQNVGYFPAVWKTAGVLLFKKKGPRDPMRPNSYRPICLLPVLGKTLERLICREVRPHIEARLSDRQYGSRPGRSTADAIKRIIETCTTTPSKYVILISVDIAGAFDNAWWPAICQSLKKMEIPSNLYALIASYLESRAAIIASAGPEEQPYVITKGCPQGSVLGPMLWAAMFDGVLLHLEQAGFSGVAYVDDLALVVTGESRRSAMLNTERAITSVMDWCEGVGLQMSAEKTAAMVVKGRFDHRHPPRAHVRSQRIAFKDTTTYLGVSLGPGPSIAPHINALTQKVSKLLNIFQSLAAPTWGMRFKPARTMYWVCVVGVMLYAVEAWHILLKRNHLQALTRIQRTALIRMTKAYRTVSHDALCLIASIPPINILITTRIASINARKGRPLPHAVPADLRHLLTEAVAAPDRHKLQKVIIDNYTL